MQAMGRLGSYISRSVYTVSGPFHPFGGAVDIIVVEQPDGSYKSSPWYVRFGKFQGVLKSKEKVVNISVNGVDADFHMYLDNKGEAFFLREVDVEESEGQFVNRWPLKLKSCNFESNWSDSVSDERKAVSGANSRRAQFLGRVFGRREGVQMGEKGSLELAEFTTDLLDLKWSTNLTSPEAKSASKDGVDEKFRVDGSSHDEKGHICPNSYQELESTTEENDVKMQRLIVKTTTTAESVREDITLSNSEPLISDYGKSDFHVSSVNIVSEVVCLHQSNGPLMTCSPVEDRNVMGEKDKNETFGGHFCNSAPPHTEAPRNGEKKELLLFGDLDGFGSSDGANESSFLLDQSGINGYLDDADAERTRLCSVPGDACIYENGHYHSRGLTRMARSLPTFVPLNGNFEASDLGQSSNPIDPDKNRQSPGAQTTAEDVTVLKDSQEESANPSLRGSRSNRPFSFKRSKGCEIPTKAETLNNSNDLERGKDVINVKTIKKQVRTLIPTSEQLASLNLKEGKNKVIFTFSTAMLGKQQVDARIFLWRWDTQIVISDVDGTITRSDLLGQVMPLVGMDWSQTGVAHLFSAIKENGYQLLFLSARSISQSFITRQFLFNIKQDGKALPDGPVVISPDGLFPSLFREVVRRAPHEFKIACLEDIKALFPPDRNPFYAGFGNRDTDEFSYLKVGIPRGKIFIINPKGEIAVNRRVDTKSYLALHALVHGMFPTMSACEQEDYNTWNYWKLPPPLIDI